MLYKHNEVLQLAYKLVRTAAMSEEQLALAKHGLNELIEKVEAAGSSTTDDQVKTQNPDVSQMEPGPAHIYGEYIY
jgi:hypothetical protein